MGSGAHKTLRNVHLRLLAGSCALVVGGFSAPGLWAAPKSPAKPAAKEISAPAKRAPALYEDTAGTNKQVVLMEFGELGLRMAGMAAFNGKTCVFLQHPGSADQMIYETGNVIGGFKVIDIQQEYTVFEKNGTNVWLPIGGTSSDEEAAADPDGEDEDLAFLEVDHKRRSLGIKDKTSAFAQEIVEVLPKALTGRFRTKASAADEGDTDKAPPLVADAGAAAGGRFIIPVMGRVESRFGYRKSPMGGGTRFHNGVDLAAPSASPILSAASGRVLKVSRSWSKGLNILIQHADGFSTAYFHLSKALVSENQIVEQGEKIGLEGSSGNSTGPHLHFEIHKNGIPVDPALYLKQIANR